MKVALARIVLLLVGVAIVEIGLRLAGVTFPIFDAYDHDRAVALEPGKKGIYDREGYSNLAINQYGYRDVEHDLEKPEGVFRIAVLGDSFTEARQVEIEDTYWKRLEHRLNADERSDGRRIEVLNFGIGGYGQAEELITLRRDASRFEPDLVLLGFYGGNDLVNNTKSLSIRLRGERFRPFYSLEEGKLVLDSSFREWSLGSLRRRFLLSATHHSRILEVVNQLRRQIAIRRLQAEHESAEAVAADDESAVREVGRTATKETAKADTRPELGTTDTQFLPPATEEWQRAWRLTEALLGEINREAQAVGAPFVVVSITSQAAVDPDAARRERLARDLGAPDLLYPERRLRAIAERHGFHMIGLTERLQRVATEQNVYLHGFENTRMGTGHWNETAHDFASRFIADDLLARGLVR